MTIASKFYGYKAVLFMSLIGLSISSQHAHSASIFSKKPQPVHMSEVVKEVNSHGLSRICSAGNVKSKLNKSDFRYRQKGNKNHDEYITAWVFCAFNADRTINKDFYNSTYGRTCQASIGGKGLRQAVNDAKNAVKEGRPARKIFCALDIDKIPEGHVVREVITYCQKLEAAEKQGVKGNKPLTQRAELIEMEDQPTTSLKSLKIQKKIQTNNKNMEDEDMDVDASDDDAAED